MGLLSGLGGPIIGLAGDLIGGLFGSNSASQANKTNIKLARENREWQANMDNTAVQRRVADIKAAGGNPALAFTNGQSASTPSVASPTVEPTFRPEWTKGGGAAALLMGAQLANIKASTAKTTEEARQQKVLADIAEAAAGQKKEYTVNHYVEAYEWDDLKTKIMRSQDITSGAQAKVVKETVDSMIARAKQDARKGQLDVEALENIAKIGGLEATKMNGIIQLIVRALTK